MKCDLRGFSAIRANRLRRGPIFPGQAFGILVGFLMAANGVCRLPNANAQQVPWTSPNRAAHWSNDSTSRSNAFPLDWHNDFATPSSLALSPYVDRVAETHRTSSMAHSVDENGPRRVDAFAPADDDDENEPEEPGDDEDEEDGIEPIIEELFLGFIVYPQEKDEVQLTFGYFDGLEAVGNSQLLFEVEYGITDRFQIGLEIPIESVAEDEPFDGVRDLGLELYYNFYANPRTGRAYGIGFEVGFPTDSAAGESRAYVYEPFAVAYQEYRAFALNFSAALEIEDPLDAGEASESAGELAVGWIGKSKPLVPLLEFQVEIAPGETPLLLAPGIYASRLLGPIDAAVSFPIGLNDDAPDFAVFFLAVLEFEAGVTHPGSRR